MLARLLTICLLLTWLGCGKTPPSPGSEAETDPAARELPAGTAPQNQQTDAAQTATTLSELTQAVRKYSVEQRRVPETLQELVANGYLPQLPTPPSGKQYAIGKNLQVYLTDE